MPASSNEGKQFVHSGLVAIRSKLGTIESFLDIGPGQGTYSMLFRAEFGGRWTGVEIWRPYVEQFELTKKYDEIIVDDARHLKADPVRKFVVGFLGDVLEHMTREEAQALWATMTELCGFVFLSIPIVRYPQGAENGNPYETHVVENWKHTSVLAAFPHIVAWSKGQVIGTYAATKRHRDTIVGAMTKSALPGAPAS